MAALVWLSGATSRLGAASPAISDLETRIAQATPAEKSPLLLQLSRAIEAADMSRAWEAAQRARQFATAPRDQLLAEAQLAALQRRRGDYTQAMAAAVAGLDRASALHDDVARVEFLFVIAQTHWSLAEYPASIETYQAVIQLAEKADRRALVARAELGIGVVHAETHQWEQARQQYERALAIVDELHADDIRAAVLNNLGVYYTAVGNYPLARATHEQALALRRALGDLRGEGDSLVNLGVVATQSGDPAGALASIQRALAIYEDLGLRRNAVNARRDLAAALRALGRHDEALNQLNAALPAAAALGSHTVFANLYREFAATFEAKGDFRAALEYTRKLSAASEAAHDESSRRRVDELRTHFAAERRQHEIALLRQSQERQEAELQRAHWQRYGLLSALLLGAITLGAVISRQRLKLRSEKRLAEEARVAQQAAEEADRVKTRFLGIASHDIRGPLGNIAFLAGELRGDVKDRELREEQLDLINSEAQRVLTLVEDLITTAALETGKLEVHLAAIDLDEIARRAIETLQWQAEAKRQTIVYADPVAGAGRCTGDAARLHQVVTNLLGNAIKFSPPGATLSLALQRTATHVVLTVRDQGAGISPRDAERLFAPFKRLATHPTAGESSHGLGLSIAQEIVQRHHGQIRVESQPGQGSTFIVELPLELPLPNT